MREDMLKNGFLLSDDRDRADITIVNSCTVTSVSDAKMCIRDRRKAEIEELQKKLEAVTK